MFNIQEILYPHFSDLSKGFHAADRTQVLTDHALFKYNLAEILFPFLQHHSGFQRICIIYDMNV